MTRRPPWTCLLLLLPALAAAPAWADDDLAAEADLQFRIGAERYQARDYRGALEHFLISNRLVANRNVLFNIARAYEQLGQFPDAFRSYAQALDAETDPAARERIAGAIARITPNVAILRVATDPPGATIFVDRRDLGPRGNAPRALAFPAGRYRVIAELAGHESAEAEVQAVVGRETAVELRLVEILGQVRIEGAPAGASVRVDEESAPARCEVPCETDLPPGRYLLWFTREGFQTASQVVQVRARETSTVRASLSPVTGSIVVDADEPEALIEVDGRPSGFTPAVVTVPVGTRTVRITLRGFRTEERTVDVRANEQTRIAIAMQPLQEVSAASRVTESVEDAPSSVTIIPREELRAMAYPTVYEALRGVRGFYIWDDRSYQVVGVRGMGRLGDYGARLLLLSDGMPINDNITGSSYTGADLRTDIADVERIEVIRGPGSVLYGTNAFSGVVNVVPRRGEPTGGDVQVSTYEYGFSRVRAGLRLRMTEDAGFWVSVAAARSEGRDFYFPEFDEPDGLGTDGEARGLDGQRTGTVTALAWWRDVTVQWLFHQRTKDVPTSEYETLFGLPGTHQDDTRGVVEVRYEPRLGERLQFFARLFAKYYRFDGDFLYDSTYGGLDVYSEVYTGLIGGAELRAVATPFDMLRLTVGGEVQQHPRADLHGESNLYGEYLDYDAGAQRLGAGYLVADLAPSNRFRLSGGARLDAYPTYGTAVSPRASLIVRPYAGGNLKIMGGSAFRAPSTYELYYEDCFEGFYYEGDIVCSTQIEPRSLDPETIYSGEIEFSHRLSARWTALVAGYGTYAKNVVILGATDDPRLVGADIDEYRNSELPIFTLGGEAEIRRDWRQGWMVSASYSLQRTEYVEGVELRSGSGREAPNAPTHLAGVRAAAPIVPRALTAATRVAAQSSVWDRYDDPDGDNSDPEQRQVDGAVVWDLVLSGESERWHLTWAAGLYNVLDWQYAAPVSREFIMRTVPQPGRTLLLSLGAEL